GEKADRRPRYEDPLDCGQADPATAVLALPVQSVGLNLESDRRGSFPLRQPAGAEPWGEPSAGESPQPNRNRDKDEEWAPDVDNWREEGPQHALDGLIPHYH